MNLRLLSAPRAHSAATLACGALLLSSSFLFVNAIARAQTTPAAAPAAKPTTTQATSAAANPTTFQATITIDEATARSDASTESGYPFGTLSKGQVVTVVESRPGWVRIRTEGPVFDGWGGYVTQLPAVKLSADGKSISITGTASVNAPNGSENYNPDRSWKAIGFLSTGDTVPVLDVVKGERETYYAVPLSAKTSCWVVASAISKNPDTAAPTNAATGNNNNSNNATNTSNNTNNGTAEATNGGSTETTQKVKAKDETAEAPKTVKKPKPAEPKPPTAAMKAIDAYKALEAKWTATAKETCPLADLQELQSSFSNVAQNTEAMQPTRRAAMLRSVQIGQVIELREMQEHAKKIAARGEDKSREVREIEDWLRARQQYTAVGVLNASVVYDGERLPRLYRLQDPTSGLTVAYLTEDPDLKLSSMLGLVVGVKGDKKYDESLRRDIIAPTSMTVLRSDKETAISSPSKVEGSTNDEGDK